MGSRYDCFGPAKNWRTDGGGGGGGSVDSTIPFERIISGMMTGDVDGGWARYNETKTRVGG